MVSEPAWTEEELLDLSGKYWESCTLHAGVKLDVFTAIGSDSLTADEVGERVGGAPRTVGILLNALAAMELLSKHGNTYANTQAGLEFLSRGSPRYLGFMILHYHHLMASWAQLPSVVRAGEPVRAREAPSEEIREAFLMGMFNLAMATAPRLAREIDLSTRRRLLDLGGGPGTHAIQFCLANPELCATVFDRPATRPFATKTIRRFGVADRVDFVGGDFLRDPLPGRNDVVWMSHILHAEGPEECRRLICRALASLEPGGLILIHDFFLDSSLDAPLYPALFALNMVLGTEQGRSYSDVEVAEMLRQAGAEGVRRLPFRGPNDSGVLAGSAPVP